MLAETHMNVLSLGWVSRDCEMCDQMAVEAWERMTFAGCGVGADYICRNYGLTYWSGMKIVYRRPYAAR